VRITGGTLRGRRIRVPRGSAVRPTAERVREALFAWLGDLSEAHVLDLFAGSGALGIEALSRGAADAVFVERSAAVAGILRANLEGLGLAERSRVMRADAGAAIRRLGAAERPFELVLVDPPYADTEAAARALRALVTSGILAPRAVVVLETSRRTPPPFVEGLGALDERRYGDTVVHLLQRLPRDGPLEGRQPDHRAADETSEAERGRPRRRSGSLRPARRKDERDADDPEGGMNDSPKPKQLALFPASFDPVTNGHLDLIHRARAVFDELVVAVARNVAKQGTFPVEERIELLEAVVGQEPGIRITSFDGLLVDYARRIGARVLVRGLRAVSDFEYEFEMALMNRHLYPEIETLFMMTSQKYFYVSSSRLKELVRFGADVEQFVPPIVAARLKEKLGGGA
jgi:pantetheine-phosphate adenylyltransferase/16S rRNA (guanine(966)-N(2))-methyltransferase RsmD